jgi:hypothetical protein
MAHPNRENARYIAVGFQSFALVLGDEFRAFV